MKVDIIDTSQHESSLGRQRDCSITPSQVIHNHSYFVREDLEPPEVPVEEEEIIDNEDILSLMSREVPLELIDELTQSPKVRFLSPKQSERLLELDKIKKMSDLERDVEGRFGML